MKLKLTMMVVTVFLQNSLFSQYFEWVRSLSGQSVSGSIGIEIAVDQSGNVFTIGNFYDAMSFEINGEIQTIESEDDVDSFISKQDSDGNFIWVRRMAAGMRNVLIDGAGDVYYTGFFTSTVDFDPGPATYNLTANGYDFFVAKFDNSGNLLWAKSAGGSETLYARGFDQDSAGNIIITGYFDGEADFDPGDDEYNLVSAGNQSAFVVKLDGEGNFIWAVAMTGTGVSRSSNICVDINDNILIVGELGGSIDFDPGEDVVELSALGASNIFYAKLDSEGHFLWAKNIGGNSANMNEGTSIATDVDGNVFITGFYSDIIDFDPSTGTDYLTPIICTEWGLEGIPTEDVFICKLDDAANFYWVKAFGGSMGTGDEGRDIEIDSEGNIYVTGWFGGTPDFDPNEGEFNIPSVGVLSSFVTKLSNDGDFIWAKKIDGEDPYCYNAPIGLALDIQNNVYTTGHFQYTIDFDPGEEVSTLTEANTSVYIHKMSDASSDISDVSYVPSVTVYPNPGNGLFTIERMDSSNGFTVADLSGRIIMSGKSSKLIRIDLSKHENGIYLVKSGTEVIKLVKN